jgi:hypothetical protein
LIEYGCNCEQCKYTTCTSRACWCCRVYLENETQQDISLRNLRVDRRNAALTSLLLCGSRTWCHLLYMSLPSELKQKYLVADISQHNVEGVLEAFPRQLAAKMFKIKDNYWYRPFSLRFPGTNERNLDTNSSRITVCLTVAEYSLKIELSVLGTDIALERKECFHNKFDCPPPQPT